MPGGSGMIHAVLLAAAAAAAAATAAADDPGQRLQVAMAADGSLTVAVGAERLGTAPAVMLRGAFSTSSPGTAGGAVGTETEVG